MNVEKLPTGREERFLLEELYECLKVEYHGDAYRWIDENHQDAFTKAVNRCDQAILFYRESKDSEFLKKEIQIYKETIVNFFKEYKRIHMKADAESFLESMKNAEDIRKK